MVFNKLCDIEPNSTALMLQERLLVTVASSRSIKKVNTRLYYQRDCKLLKIVLGKCPVFQESASKSDIPLSVGEKDLEDIVSRALSKAGVKVSAMALNKQKGSDHR